MESIFVNIDISCIYLGACGHGTATAAKYANKEMGLEYASSREG